MRFISLSEEEKTKLESLYKTSNSSVIRQRCLSLIYSNQRRSINEVSSLAGVSRRTTERFFNAWESAEDKYTSLSIADGRGPKVKLASVKDQLPDLVEKYSRNLNLVLEALCVQYQIEVCKLTLQNFLKDNGI
jgi:transposase